MSTMKALIEALFQIYSRAGAEVHYTTDRGERRRYWANRFRQALQRAVDNDDVIPFVIRLVTEGEPSRGFGYLKDAARLDLSVEALVVEQFPDMFPPEAVEAAKARLVANGYQPKAPMSGVAPGTKTLAEVLKEHAGESFDVRVTVAHNGAMTFNVI